MEIRFKITLNGILQFAISFLFFLAFSYYAIIELNIYIGFLFIMIFYRLFLYNTIDYVIVKKIIRNNEGLFLVSSFYKIKLDSAKTLILWENVFVFKHSSSPSQCLILCRNLDRLMSFSFKNKIRLTLSPNQEDFKKYKTGLKSIGLNIQDVVPD